ncbi:MAG: helix-turn-helix transcriptional regulator [bacterium]|nr:helix-turn-helix transcriptional regulator [bacterium]
MSIGSKIREIRKSRNFSQGDLAERLGAYLTNISRYERDLQIPSAEIIKKLAVIFEVSADYFLFDEVSESASAKIKDKTLLEFVERVDNLPNEQKKLVVGVMDAVLFKYEVKRISSKG